jgi:hypothetical protein
MRISLAYVKILEEELFKYVEMQAKGLSLAEAFLRINPDYLGLSVVDGAFVRAEGDARHQAFG